MLASSSSLIATADEEEDRWRTCCERCCCWRWLMSGCERVMDGEWFRYESIASELKLVSIEEVWIGKLIVVKDACN